MVALGLVIEVGHDFFSGRLVGDVAQLAGESHVFAGGSPEKIANQLAVKLAGGSALVENLVNAKKHDGGICAGEDIHRQSWNLGAGEGLRKHISGGQGCSEISAALKIICENLHSAT